MIASFLKQFYSDHEVETCDLNPSCTSFSFEGTEEEVEFSARSFMDLSDIEPEEWVFIMSQEIKEDPSFKNLLFFGICEAPEGDIGKVLNPDEEYFFMVCYFEDTDEFEGRLFDLDFNSVGVFDIYNAFPEFSTVDFKSSSTIH